MSILRSLHLLATTPRRLWLRRAVFQIHLWAGVVLGLYTVVIGLTGSGLVFRDEIDRALHPALQRATTTRAHIPLTIDLDAVVAEASRQNPGFVVRGLQDLERLDQAPSVFLEAERATRTRTTSERIVYFDPETGRILGKRDRYGGFLGWCANLHYYLLAGARGSLINGILAACFAVVSISGWLLWWPGLRSIIRALRIHWRARWPRLTWDLHTVGGFWINPALFLTVLTGVIFVFPAPFFGALAILSGGSLADARAYLTDPAGTPAKTRPISLQQAYLVAHKAMPPGVWIGYLSVPADPGESYNAIGYRLHAAPYSMPIRVSIDRYRGTLLAVRDARRLPWGLRAATYIYAVHFGSFAGWFSKGLWFLLGLTPAALLVTGALMWWRRSLRRTLFTRTTASLNAPL